MKLATRLGGAVLFTVAYVSTLIGAAFAFLTVVYGLLLITGDSALGNDWMWAFVSLVVTIAAFWIRKKTINKREEMENNDTSDVVRR